MGYMAAEQVGNQLLHLGLLQRGTLFDGHLSCQ